MRNDSQKGNPTHQPTITRPGSTKMIADSVPAAEATVCTMLFSRIDESLTMLRMAIEITAAGIDEANVSPTLRPRYTLAAVNTTVRSEPSTSPRRVSSFGMGGADVIPLRPDRVKPGAGLPSGRLGTGRGPRAGAGWNRHVLSGGGTGAASRKGQGGGRVADPSTRRDSRG